MTEKNGRAPWCSWECPLGGYGVASGDYVAVLNAASRHLEEAHGFDRKMTDRTTTQYPVRVKTVKR